MSAHTIGPGFQSVIDLSACLGIEKFGWMWRFSHVNERSKRTIGFKMKIMSFKLTLKWMKCDRNWQPDLCAPCSFQHALELMAPINCLDLSYHTRVYIGGIGWEEISFSSSLCKLVVISFWIQDIFSGREYGWSYEWFPNDTQHVISISLDPSPSVMNGGESIWRLSVCRLIHWQRDI